MNVNPYITTDYERKRDWTLGESKPNSNPIKPNFQKAKMNANVFVTKDYRKKDDFSVRINKPNSKPICQRVKLMQSLYLQRIMKNNADMGYENSNPNKPNFKLRAYPNNRLVMRPSENLSAYGGVRGQGGWPKTPECNPQPGGCHIPADADTHKAETSMFDTASPGPAGNWQTLGRPAAITTLQCVVANRPAPGRLEFVGA